MTARRFGSTMLTTGTQSIMVGGMNKDSTVTVIFTNHGTTVANVFMAYVVGTSLTNIPADSWLVFNEVIQPNSRLEVKGIVVEQNTMLAANVAAGSSNVSSIVYGFEEEI